MTDRLELPLRYRRELEALLREHVPDAEVWAYGSRVSGESHAASDLDLVLRGPNLEPLGHRFSDLLEALEDSNIPILIQAHDWARLPKTFHGEIERDYVVVQEGDEQTTADGWQTTFWGDLATLEYGKSLRDYDSPTGLHRVYGTNGPIGWHNESLCPYASVIIGRKGAYRGVHYSPDPFFVIDTAFYLKPKVELDTRWAYYQLLTLDINGMDSGSAIPSTSREDFYRLSGKVPPLPEQRAIAHALGTLDDKIELNRRMNDTLEEMARALFKSWFVDFDPVRAKMDGRDTGLPPELADLFPDRLVPSELGEMPDGWSAGPFGNAVTQMRQNENPLTSPATVYSHFSIPAYDAGQTPTQQIGKSIKSSKSQVRPGVVLLSKLNPEIERVWLVDIARRERAVCSTEFLVLQARPPFQRSYIYCFTRSQHFREQIVSLATGTSKSHQRARADAVLAVAMILPPTQIIKEFEQEACALLNHSLARRRESRTLAAQRDALLPKLISGQIRVTNIADALGSAN